MNVKLTASMEKYLVGIYKLASEGKPVRTSELVEFFNVAPGTVTNTVRRLKKEGLVIHHPYKGVRLTGKGLKIAFNVAKKYEVLERFLTDVLGVEKVLARQLTIRIGYHIPDDVVVKIEKSLLKA
ncbi:MAG: metal-dependent transcriptional regulator [Candidatus Bathyarchaeia archaeon]